MNDLNQINKELLLENSLRSSHCRPMVRMFKVFNSEEMMADVSKDFNEQEFTENAKAYLSEYRARYSEKVDIEQQLQYGNLDNDVRRSVAKQFTKDIYFNDLDQVINGESLSPKVYKAYL